MNFSIAQTIRRLLAPRHELSCSRRLWRRLLTDLRHRGRGVTESGAFLLGTRDGAQARIHDYILYDDLDPNSLSTGIVRFDGRYFGTLWDRCRSQELDVVADVHVHPGDSGQSASDRWHPMIASAGHIALIVPDFARAPVHRERLGIYRYQGAKQWTTIPSTERRRFFYLG